MADTQKFLQSQSFSLASSGVSVGDTTMILSSMTDIDGNTIVMTDIGSKGWLTIEPNSGSREEQISFTGITQNANGTATITGVKNVGFKDPYTETSGFLKSHPGGAIAVISNTAGFYANMTSKSNDETISGQYTFTDPKIPKMDSYSIPTDDEQFATKKYVDDTAGGTPISINRIVVSGTAGETVAIGNLVYLDETDNEWKLADASTSATCDNVQLGIAQGAGTNGNPITGGVLLQGRETNQSGLVQGDKIYASDTAGAIASSAGTIEVELGHAISATAIDFQPKFSSYTTKLQRDALVGTSGTPSSTNKYVTADERTATPTASKIPLASGGGKLADGWLNNNQINTVTLNAGETINGATLPVAVYQSAADNEIYACDGNDATKLDFIGFGITNGTDGNPITVQTQGIVSGFTGLTEGSRYYVKDDKTIGTTAGTYKVLVGIAISETQLSIRNSDITDYKVGQTTYNVATASGTQTIVHGLGRIPKVVKLKGSMGAANYHSESYGVFNGATNSCAYGGSNGTNPGLAGGDTTNSIVILQSADASNKASGVVSVDATNITITWTKTGSPTGTAYIQWEVQG